MRLFACLLVALAACAAEPQRSLGVYGDPCVRNSDCAQPNYCRQGTCICDCDPVCSAGKIRCNGDSVEQCSEQGDRWDVLEDCPTGCSNNACRPAACTANERRCDGTMTFQCLSTGAGWVFLEECARKCTGGTCDRGQCACP